MLTGAGAGLRRLGSSSKRDSSSSLSTSVRTCGSRKQGSSLVSDSILLLLQNNPRLDSFH